MRNYRLRSTLQRAVRILDVSSADLPLPDYGRVARENEAAGAADATACPTQAASEMPDRKSNA